MGRLFLPPGAPPLDPWERPEASDEIVTTYCRPFAKSDRDVIVGKAWTAGFSADKLALHHRVLILRNNDAAHTAGYVGRVNLFIQSVPSDETQPIAYSV